MRGAPNFVAQEQQNRFPHAPPLAATSPSLTLGPQARAELRHQDEGEQNV